jgi:3D (Asp-Asp-Asp) domain-containing protein
MSISLILYRVNRENNMTSDDYERKTKTWIKIILPLLLITGLAIGLAIQKEKCIDTYKKLNDSILSAFNSSLQIKEQTMGLIMFDLKEEEEKGYIVYAWTTGFNSVKEQTDSTPCIGAGGYICGRKQVVACPRYIPLGTWVKIDGKEYECLDRLNEKYDDRFDIFFDKDIQGAINYGKQYKEIMVLYN